MSGALKWWIRSAALADADAIGTIVAESRRASFRGIVPDALLEAVTEEGCRQAWRRALVEHGARWIDLVAESERGVIACSSTGPVGAGVGRSHAAFELYEIHVRAEHARRSIGRTLVEQTLAALGGRTLQAVCLRDNPARGFYPAIGGRLVDEGAHEAGETMLTHCIYVL